MQDTFADWQPQYAERRVATFPVTIGRDEKKPNVVGYMKVGLRGSAQLANKFPGASSFGFTCGPSNGITVVDMDDTDPTIVREAERLFGRSPLLWRTGSGKFAMAFRHNGEARRIRPIPTLPIDLLGGGYCVAPPSAGAVRRYEIIEGTLADLDRLPKARMPAEILSASSSRTKGKIPKGGTTPSSNTAGRRSPIATALISFLMPPRPGPIASSRHRCRTLKSSRPATACGSTAEGDGGS